MGVTSGDSFFFNTGVREMPAVWVFLGPDLDPALRVSASKPSPKRTPGF